MKNKSLKTLLQCLGLALVCVALLATNGTAKEAMQLDELHFSKGVSCADCHSNSDERKPVAMVTCMECHDTEELAKTTADVKPTNPHENRHYGTEADCNLCHHQHRKSENFCLPCHARFTLVTP